jgi:hypothetical protein
VIRTSKRPGPITITASAPGLTNGSEIIQTQAVEPQAELH